MSDVADNRGIPPGQVDPDEAERQALRKQLWAEHIRRQAMIWRRLAPGNKYDVRPVSRCKEAERRRKRLERQGKSG